MAPSRSRDGRAALPKRRGRAELVSSLRTPGWSPANLASRQFRLRVPELLEIALYLVPIDVSEDQFHASQRVAHDDPDRLVEVYVLESTALACYTQLEIFVTQVDGPQ